jgi:hypothetical protein
MGTVEPHTGRVIFIPPPRATASGEGGGRSPPGGANTSAPDNQIVDLSSLIITLLHIFMLIHPHPTSLRSATLPRAAWEG